MTTRFYARVRKRNDAPSAPIKVIYRHPTVAALAEASRQARPTRRRLVSKTCADLRHMHKATLSQEGSQRKAVSNMHHLVESL